MRFLKTLVAATFACVLLLETAAYLAGDLPESRHRARLSTSAILVSDSTTLDHTSDGGPLDRTKLGQIAAEASRAKDGPSSGGNTSPGPT